MLMPIKKNSKDIEPTILKCLTVHDRKWDCPKERLCDTENKIKCPKCGSEK